MAKIPRVYHFVFGLKPQTEPFHIVYYLCLESCRQVNQPEAIYFHYQHEPFGPYWDLIKPHLTLVAVEPSAFLANYQYTDSLVARYRYAHLADLVRLNQLLLTGGVYADIDTLFINPPRADLWEKSFVMGEEDSLWNPARQEYEPSLCNAVLMAERDAPFGRRWIPEIERVFDGTWSRHSCQLPRQLATAHPEEVHVEPARTFYPYMWTKRGLRDLLHRCQRDLTGVVSIHLWHHLWWEKTRTEFSRLHAGRMTWHYIAEVDTTYTVAARRFLPLAPLEPDDRPWWRKMLDRR